MPPLQGDGKKQAKKPTFFSHPDFTVGTGITPVQPKKVRGLYRRSRNFTLPRSINSTIL